MTERLPAVPDLTCCLRRLLEQVPTGRVTTCGDLAEALGNRMAAKWIGHFALHHEHDAACTCHRILRAGGELGAYMAGSMAAKAEKAGRRGRRRAARRGGSRTVRVSPVRFRSPFGTTAKGRKRRSRPAFPCGRGGECQNSSGGVDVAYPSPDIGVAAYALVETATGRLVWSTTVRRRVIFPYISTYLSFREIPILLDLLDEVRAAGRMAPVLIGRRQRHPSPSPRRHRLAPGRCGLAAHGRSDQETALWPRCVSTKRGQVQFVLSTRRAVPANWTSPLFSRASRGPWSSTIGLTGRGDPTDGRQSSADLHFARPSGRRCVLRGVGSPAALRPPVARAALLGRPAEPERMKERLEVRGGGRGRQSHFC